MDLSKEKSGGQAANIQAHGMTIRSQGLESRSMKMVISMKEAGTKVREKVKEHSGFKMRKKISEEGTPGTG